MSKSTKADRKPPGSAPGTVVYIGEVDKATPVTISRMRYSSVECEEQVGVPLAECKPDSAWDGVTWHTVDGVHNTEILERLGEAFNLHPLIIEDIANTKQRPKVEEFDNCIFVALKMITYDTSAQAIRAEHVSVVLGDGFVLSFLEDKGDVFEPLRARLRTGKGRIRRRGADYLAYSIIDAIVDYYFEVLEELGEDIEEVEHEVVEAPAEGTLRSIHTLKRELIYLRRAVWPLRETVNVLLRDESDRITPETRVFLRDLYDHTMHVVDTVETLRDIVSGMLDVYLSSISNKMNQVMKVLTVMSSIFIPLTFIVGLYGMNFAYMPELQWRWGYPAVITFMAMLSISLMVVFRRKGWL